MRLRTIDPDGLSRRELGIVLIHLVPRTVGRSLRGGCTGSGRKGQESRGVVTTARCVIPVHVRVYHIAQPEIPLP